MNDAFIQIYWNFFQPFWEAFIKKTVNAIYQRAKNCDGEPVQTLNLFCELMEAALQEIYKCLGEVMSGMANSSLHYKQKKTN